MIRPRRLTVALLAILLASFAGASGQPAQPQQPQSPPAQPPAGAEGGPPLSFRVLADQITGLFPAVQGDVIEVTGSRVILSTGRGQGVQVGLELTGYREGRELFHPRTKQSLGKIEETLGRLVVAQVFENYSVATHVDGPKLEVGDKARVTAGKIRLTVVPLTPPARARVAETAVQEFLQELERAGRFQIGFGDQVVAWLGQEKIAAEDFLKGTAVQDASRKFNLTNVLVLHFTTVDGKLFMDARVFAQASPTPLFQSALFVPPSVRPRQTQTYSAGGNVGDVKVEKRSLLARLLSGDWEPNKYSSSATAIPVRLAATFPFLVMSMDVAVAPADKQARIVVTDGQKVYAYRVSGDKLDAEWTYDKLMVGNILTVQFADLDGDGTLEVVVNRQDVKSGMLSYILGVKQGRVKPIVQDIPLMLLAVDEQGKGVNRELWGARPDTQAFWAKGGAMRYVLKGDDVSAAARAIVPESFRLVGATFSNIAGKDGRVLAYVDEFSRLRISAGAQEMWRSLTVVGGGLARAQITIPIFQTNVDKFFKMEPNPVAVDLDGDGLQEIIVPINDEEAGRLGVVYRGPAGFRMQIVQSGFEGMIIGIGAIPGDTTPSIVLAVLRRAGLLRSTGETQIVMTAAE